MVRRVKQPKQKLRSLLHHNPLVYAMYMRHRCKVNAKFLIRTISVLAEQNKELMRMLSDTQKYNIHPRPIYTEAPSRTPR